MPDTNTGMPGRGYHDPEVVCGGSNRSVISPALYKRRPVTPDCRSQIESSYSRPSRKFLFGGLIENPHGMFAQSRRGRAWRGCPKPRRRSWLREQSAQALQTAIKTRVVSTGRRGGPSRTTVAFGETPERRLWAIQREDRRACPAHQIVIRRSLSTTAGWGDRRSPASRCSCLRRCDLCGLV